MAEVYANDFATTLTADCTAAAVSLSVAAAAPAALQSGYFRVAIGDELLLVTAGQATTTWTVTRGIEGTTAAAHLADAVVAHVLTAASIVAPAIDLWVGPMDPRLARYTVVAVANQADLSAFQVRNQVTVSKVLLPIIAQSGNLDVGLYDASGVKLATSGSTAVGTASTVQTVNLSAPVTLYPGLRYYSAVAFDNSTASMPEMDTILATLIGTLGLEMRFATSFPLPASFTLAGANSASRHWAPVFIP